MKWKPISSAPRDGTSVLLCEITMIENFGPIYDIVLGSWGDVEVFGEVTQGWQFQGEPIKPLLWNKVPHFDINEHLGVLNEGC